MVECFDLLPEVRIHGSTSPLRLAQFGRRPEDWVHAVGMSDQPLAAHSSIDTIGFDDNGEPARCDREIWRLKRVVRCFR
jgi:hypothetical protein